MYLDVGAYRLNVGAIYDVSERNVCRRDLSCPFLASSGRCCLRMWI